MPAALALLLALQAPAATSGHSHNDYLRGRPLQDALDAGILSVEADVFPVDGELRLGHDAPSSDAARTLRRIYLDPLAARPAGSPEVWLLVDVKRDPEAAMKILDDTLADYRESATTYSDKNGVQVRKFRVILSAVEPDKERSQARERRFFFDGRPADLDPEQTRDAQLVPLVSADFGAKFTWRGDGQMPFGEESRLRRFVNRATEQGQRTRFWNVPENPAVWDELRRVGVSYIGTDDPAKLAGWLKGR